MTFSTNFTLEYMKGILEAVEQEEKLCGEVLTVQEFTYLGDRVSAGGGCEAAVTVRTRCGWVTFRECGELLNGRFPPSIPYDIQLVGCVTYNRHTV